MYHVACPQGQMICRTDAGAGLLMNNGTMASVTASISPTVREGSNLQGSQPRMGTRGTVIILGACGHKQHREEHHPRLVSRRMGKDGCSGASSR